MHDYNLLILHGPPVIGILVVDNQPNWSYSLTLKLEVLIHVSIEKTVLVAWLDTVEPIGIKINDTAQIYKNDQTGI